LELAIEHIRSKYPKARLYALGISIGANSVMKNKKKTKKIYICLSLSLSINKFNKKLIKYAAAKGDNCPLRGIACIANPWNINSNFAELKKFSNRIYDFALAGRFVRNFKANIEQFKNLPTIDASII
jgi:predicted alpha/beta-fold hydrolase